MLTTVLASMGKTIRLSRCRPRERLQLPARPATLEASLTIACDVSEELGTSAATPEVRLLTPKASFSILHGPYTPRRG